MRNTTAALEKWLAQGGRRIGQIAIARSAGGWILQHTDDAGRTDLTRFTRAQDARQLANLDDAGAYRALKTAPTLRHGWQLELAGVKDVQHALDYFYPAMLGVRLSFLEQAQTPVPLRETLSRQTGMYRVTQKLTDAEAQSLIARTCDNGACLKTVLWKISPEVPIQTLPPEKFVPRNETAEWPMWCQEACNFLVAAARKVVKGETKE